VVLLLLIEWGTNHQYNRQCNVNSRIDWIDGLNLYQTQTQTQNQTQTQTQTPTPKVTITITRQNVHILFWYSKYHFFRLYHKGQTLHHSPFVTCPLPYSQPPGNNQTKFLWLHRLLLSCQFLLLHCTQYHGGSCLLVVYFMTAWKTMYYICIVSQPSIPAVVDWLIDWLID
jgi:hypothetical protein